MTDLQTAAQQALEALTPFVRGSWTPGLAAQAAAAMACLESALAEPPVDDPHGDHWVAIAEAAQKIAASKECGPAEAKALCAALDRLTEAALAEPEPPPDAQTEAEKMAYCAGWWAALEKARKAEPQRRKTGKPRNATTRLGVVCFEAYARSYVGSNRWDIAAEAVRRAALAEPVQEPVKQCMAHGECFGGKCIYQPPAEPVQEPGCRDDGMPASDEERHLRRLLALRAAMPHTYYDDGEAQGAEHGISIDFMREPAAHIDAKLRALNVARMIAKEAQPVQGPQGCGVCNHPLYAGIKCRVCGRGKA